MNWDFACIDWITRGLFVCFQINAVPCLYIRPRDVPDTGFNRIVFDPVLDYSTRSVGRNQYAIKNPINRIEYSIDYSMEYSIEYSVEYSIGTLKN